MEGCKLHHSVAVRRHNIFHKVNLCRHLRFLYHFANDRCICEPGLLIYEGRELRPRVWIHSLYVFVMQCVSVNFSIFIYPEVYVVCLCQCTIADVVPCLSARYREWTLGLNAYPLLWLIMVRSLGLILIFLRHPSKLIPTSYRSCDFDLGGLDSFLYQ